MSGSKLTRGAHRRPLVKTSFWGKIIPVMLLVGMVLISGAVFHRNKAMAADNGGTKVLSMKDLGSEKGVTLKTVRTERVFYFNKPLAWQATGGSVANLTIQHSPSLLPNRSHLNVVLNDRILQTMALDGGSVKPTHLAIPLPPNLMESKNKLVLQVDQHYTDDCEDPFSQELWTTILPESNLVLSYQLKPAPVDLAQLPYPFYDPLNYGQNILHYVVSPEVSSESLEALGVLSAKWGQWIGWHPVTTVVDDRADWHVDDHLIVVGTPAENKLIRALQEYLPIPVRARGFVDPKSGVALPEDAGLLMMIRNPDNPAKSIMVVSGNSPKGVAQAARVLAHHPSNRLLTGAYAVVYGQQLGPLHPFRAWDGFIQKNQVSLADLGLETQTARSITASPIYYAVKKMPDMYLQGGTKVKLKAIYSYSSQLDTAQSKLEVMWNGKSLKSIPLDKKEGANLAEVTIEIPAEDLFTYNDLAFQFYLFPEKYDKCRFVTDVHLWGTVHNSSTLDLPAKLRALLPDLGLLNDGGYPFTLNQDLSQLAVVLPSKTEAVDVETMVSMLTRLGRLSQSKTGINLTVSRPEQVSADVKKDHHFIVIGPESRNAFVKEFQSKSLMVLKNETRTLRLTHEQQTELTTLNQQSAQGLLESLFSPWNNSRVALLVPGPTDNSLREVGRLFEDDTAFAAIQPGNLLIVNSDGPKSLTLYAHEGEAHFVTPVSLAGGSSDNGFLGYLNTFFVILGVLSILRWLFGRRKPKSGKR
ncbi:MAG: cellulose biosynthesis cyclic di-GMP-binding regulatory protein BcsB [Cyanobacteria bacterium]|nr:cellulose biosynthesis cyclic di-GMP-binding regulatory protein BcsB [Cyanobacteriota bacterium]